MTRGTASAWLPRKAASSMAGKGAKRVPVATRIASASAISDVAAVKSPLCTPSEAMRVSMNGSWRSAPASRAS